MIGASGRRGKYLTILRAIGGGLMHTSPYAPDPTPPTYLDPQGAWAGLRGVVQVIAERRLDWAYSRETGRDGGTLMADTLSSIRSVGYRLGIEIPGALYVMVTFPTQSWHASDIPVKPAPDIVVSAAGR